MSDKEIKIIEAVYDAVLLAADRFQEGKGFNTLELQALLDSVRILHHVQNMHPATIRPGQIMAN